MGTILPTNAYGHFESPLGFEAVRNTNLLGYQINELRTLKKDPIVIIGPDGDDYLRCTKSLVDRKMVFSKHTPIDLLDQILIGLQGAGTCAFFLPLNVPVPPANVWSELETALAQMEYGKGPHVIRPTFRGKPGWPLLITPKGKDWLEELPERVQEGSNETATHPLANPINFLELPGLEIQNLEASSETVLQELKTTDDFQEWKSLYTA